MKAKLDDLLIASALLKLSCTPFLTPNSIQCDLLTVTSCFCIQGGVFLAPPVRYPAHDRVSPISDHSTIDTNDISTR